MTGTFYLSSEKDATFIERKTQTRGAAAYELFNHPGWFMCHDTSSKFGLVARKVEIKSREFLLGCLYMAVAQKPTKQELKERLKLSDVKNESAEARGNVRNISGIISNDVSPENLVKDNPGNESGSSLEKGGLLMDHQINKTDDRQLLNKTKSAKNDAAPSTLSSNATAANKSSSEKTLDQKSDSTPVKNSTRQTGETAPLRDVNTLDITAELQLTNVTQKPKIGLQKNKLDLLVTDIGKELSENGKNKLEVPATNKLKNSSNTLNDGLGKAIASSAAKINPQHKGNTLTLNKNQTGRLSSFAPMQAANPNLNPYGLGKGISSTAAKINPLHKGNTLALNKNQTGRLSSFAPKQAANPNLNPYGLGKGITSTAAKINPLHKGNILALNKNQTGRLSSFAPKQAVNPNLNPYGKQQFTMHFEIPNDEKSSNAFPNQLAQITAKALGFIHSAFRNQQSQKQRQMAPQITKLGPVFVPFQQQQQQQNQQLQMAPQVTKVGALSLPLRQQQPQQQQQQQKQFQRPSNYINQQVSPQEMFRSAPNYINAPAPVAPGRPLGKPFAFKTPNSQFAHQQFKTPGPQQLFKNYQSPGKSWAGLVSIGKQSLVGNSANFHDNIQNKANQQEKSKPKIEDEPDKISENGELKLQEKT